MYTIERGIKIPPKLPKSKVKAISVKGKSGAFEYYPWSKLKVGESFTVKGIMTRSTIGPRPPRESKKFKNKRFITRTINFKDCIVIRVK